MLVANGHLKTVLKKFCMMLTEKNDFVQIVLFRRLLCSYICSIKCQLPIELNYRNSHGNYRHIVYV